MRKLRAAAMVLTALAALGCSEKPGTVTASAPAATGESNAQIAAAKGQAIFATRCAYCHGLDGAGDTPFAAGFPNVNLSDGVFAFGSSRPDIERNIAKGIQGTSMTGFDTLLTPEEIGAVTDHVLTLRPPAPPT